jgi:hypothetical protein
MEGASRYTMNQKRIQKPLVAGGVIGLIAIAGTSLFVVRNLLAAFLMFAALFGALGITVLASFLIGEGVTRCFELLMPVRFGLVFVNKP